jgi:hypothetical protein
LARADGLAGATLAEDALAEDALAGDTTSGEGIGGPPEAAAVTWGNAVGGAVNVPGDRVGSVGVAEWLLAVQAAVTRTGTATRAAIATRRGRGGRYTGVILSDRLPV